MPRRADPSLLIPRYLLLLHQYLLPQVPEAALVRGGECLREEVLEARGQWHPPIPLEWVDHPLGKELVRQGVQGLQAPTLAPQSGHSSSIVIAAGPLLRKAVVASHWLAAGRHE